MTVHTKETISGGVALGVLIGEFTYPFCGTLAVPFDPHGLGRPNARAATRAIAMVHSEIDTQLVLVSARKSRGADHWNDARLGDASGPVVGRIMRHPQAPDDQSWFSVVVSPMSEVFWIVCRKVGVAHNLVMLSRN